MLNAVSVPPGIDEAAVRKRLLEEDGIEIGAGLGPLAGKIWRVGLMGHTARAENVERFLVAMKKRTGKIIQCPNRYDMCFPSSDRNWVGERPVTRLKILLK